jgi:ABC-type branched-subunit amino acid transport system ATPase component
VTTIAEDKARLASMQKQLTQAQGEAVAIARRGKFAQVASQAAGAKAVAAEEAARLLGQYADNRQAKIIAAIEGICSAGLTSVFGEQVQLKLNQVVKARRVEVEISVKTGDLETPIMDARGGGMAAVAGFLLKVTRLLLTRGARRIIVADEPFSQLSSDYAPKVAEFLAELCEQTGLQIIMVTHDDAFAEAADRVIRLKTKDGKAVAEVVR